MLLVGTLLHLLAAIACGVHAGLHGRALYWVALVFVLPGIGVLLYFIFAEPPQAESRRPARVKAAPLDAALQRAEAALGGGDTDTAIARFTHCAQTCVAEDTRALRGLMRTLLVRHDAQEAVAVARAFRQRHARLRAPALDRLHAQALSLSRQGDAEADFRRMIAQGEDVAVLCHYADWLRGFGREAEADGVYADVMASRALGLHPASARDQRWIRRAEHALDGH